MGGPHKKQTKKHNKHKRAAAASSDATQKPTQQNFDRVSLFTQPALVFVTLCKILKDLALNTVKLCQRHITPICISALALGVFFLI